MKIEKQFQYQQGVTLLEILIAILVLSFGLLGMLGLTTNSIKITSTSYYRTIAAHQITMMADMINANPYVFDYYAPPTIRNPDTFNTNCLSTSGCPHVAGNNSLKKVDSAQYDNMPDNDYLIWRKNIEALLPYGKGIVCLDDSPDDGSSSDFKCSATGRPTIKICWNESSRINISRGGADGSEASADTCRVTQL